MAYYMGHEYTPATAMQPCAKYRVGDRVRHKTVPGAGAGVVQSDEGANRGDGERYYRVKYEHYDICTDPEDVLQPAFRPGDRVRLNKHFGARACGERGTVSSVWGDAACVRMDDASLYGTVVAALPADVLDWERVEEGKQHAPNPGQFGKEAATVSTVTADEFKIIWPVPRPQPCIIARVDEGQPRPASLPHVHASVEAATKEAERLARNNPGQEFAVYQRVAGRRAEVSVEMKEVA